MNDRDQRPHHARPRSGGRSGRGDGVSTDRRDRPSRSRDDQRRGAGSANRPSEPSVPDDVTPQDLDPTVRRDLLTLDRMNSDAVARHLVMTSRLLDDDPDRALEHARAARGRASRIAVVRETVGVAAYNAQEWTEALSELKAARRMSGNTTLLPLIADCERGLGRPDRAIDIARSEEGRALTGDEAIEMRIVESGARIDLGEAEKAVVTLQAAGLDPAQTGTGPARLFYTYATALEAAGRPDDAVTWFMNAASADVDDVTDAELRLVELTDSDRLGSEQDQEESDETQTRPDLQRGRKVLADDYDALLFDLDGTLYAGSVPIDGAVDTLRQVTQPVYFVTNNASRRAPEVAEHLADLGFGEAEAEKVITSAQTAARLLAEHLEPGSRALVVGTDGLAQEIREVGIGVTRSASDRPAAVVQGHSTETGWAQLSEAVLAIGDGALWIACNVDPTLPSERGFMIGNGSMVAAVANATGRKPLVAGKPAEPLMRDALERSGATKPIVVGDRLDTDIEGANAVGADSLLVLTGVSTVGDAMCATPEQRPTHIASDLAALLDPVSRSAVATSSGWRVDFSATLVTVGSTDDAVTDVLLPALLKAAWQSSSLLGIDPNELRFTSTDEAAAAALRHHGLLSDSVTSR